MSRPVDRRTSLRLVARACLVVGLLLFGLVAVQSVLATGEATSTLLETNGSPAIFGDTVTFTATVTDTVTPSDIPTGTVDFMDGTFVLGPGTLDVNGVATLEVDDLAAGTHSISADYLGADPNFDISTSVPVSQEIDNAPTTTTLMNNTGSAVWGQSVSLTATVSSAGGIPTGSIDFKDGLTLLHNIQLDDAGAASYSTSSLAVGSHTLSATYVPVDASFLASSDSLTNQDVGKADSDVEVTTVSDDTVTGQSYNVAVTVSAVLPGAGTPTGTVAVSDGTATCLSPIALVGGGGTCSLDSTSAGAKTITATYIGDSQFNGGSGTVSHTVDADATSASVTSIPHPSKHGQSVTFTGSVSADGPGGGIPTGTVTFMDGGNPLGSPTTLNGAGQATLTTATLSTSTHSITVVYAGDGNYAGVTSPIFSQVVNQASTTTVVARSDGTDPSPFGSSLTFTATVASVSPGAGTPTGTVQFKDGASDLGAPATVSAGQATLSTSSLGVGPHTISAVYSGDNDFIGSSDSTGTSQQVDKAASSTAVATSASPSDYGQAVTFTATVSGAGSTPTGAVTFKDGATTLGSRSLVAGAATFTTSTPLSGGSHAITVAYGGDGNYDLSSGTLSGGQQVDKVALTVTADDKTRAYGQLNPAFTVSYSGFVNSEDFNSSDLMGSPACSTVADTSSAAGSPYAITCAAGTLTSSDYSFDFIAGTLTITKATSSTVVSSNHNPSVFGQAVTFTATIGGFGSGTATGDVDFIIDGGAPHTGAVSGTIATYTTAALSVGAHTVEADYSGDADLTTSTDTLDSNQAVNKASSLTQITTDLSSATKVGASYNVAASVSAVSPGAGTPGGTVNVTDGLATCHITLTGGSGSCSLTSTTKGRSKTITATYTGDGNFAISSDSTLHVVDAVPVAVADSYIAYEAGGSPNQLIVPVGSGVLANDTDADSDQLTARNPSTPPHGTLVLNSNGSFTYTPASLYVGPDSFTYTAYDGYFDSIAVTVSITVQAVNQPPTFTLNTSTVTVNENQYDASADVILNKATGWSQGTGDTGQTALAYKVSASPSGLLSQLGIDSSGTLSFRTLFGVPGSATITVRAQDNGGVAHGGVDTSAPQSFTIVVTYKNQQPFANADVVQVGQSSTSNPLNVLANDSPGPPDEQAGGGHPQTVSVASVTQPIDSNGLASGTATIVGGGSFINFVPKPGFTCQVSTPKTPSNCVTFTYIIKDSGSPQGTSTAGTVFITVLPSTSRLAGTDRYATDAAIVTGNYGPSPVVYVATGTGFADGLTGAAAAGTLHAPLILINGQGSSIPAVTKAALLAVIGPSTQIRVLGGTGSINTAIFGLLSAMAPRAGGLPDIIRLADDTRYDTAVAVSRNSYPTTLASHSVFIASGLSYPDALAAAAAAGHLGAPLLLVPGTNSDLSAVPKVRLELQRLAPTTIYIVGGTGVIVPSMRTAIQSAVPHAMLVLLAGADRYQTATKVADQFFRNPAVPPFDPVPVGTVYIASGLNFPDALAGAALAGGQGAPVLLVPGTSTNLDGVVEAGHKVILEELGMSRLFPNRIVVFGASGAVSTGIFNELARIPRS